MKVNPKFLMMMAVLAAGAASAAAPTPARTGNLTNAGVVITNQATATFDDPTTGTTIVTPVPSNTVTTTVEAKQAFNITYSDGGDTDATDTLANAIAAYKVTAQQGSPTRRSSA